MNEIILKIDLEGQWLLHHHSGVIATANPVEPGLSLCTIRFHAQQTSSIIFEKQPGSKLLYCRFDMEAPSFVTHTAEHPVKQTFGNGTSCYQLIIVMTRQWMTANLGLLATPEGRITQAYKAGLSWFAYRDNDHRVRQLFQRLIIPSSEKVIYKGMVLELLSFTWSRLTLQKRPDTYANKIA